MTIRDCEGVSPIIGAGDIGKCISDYLTTISPNLDVIVCGRNLINNNECFTGHRSQKSHRTWYTFCKRNIL